MFLHKNSEYFFTQSLKFGLIEENKYSAADVETSSIGMKELLDQAIYCGKRADIYWAAFCGVTKPVEPAPHMRRYHNPPQLAA